MATCPGRPQGSTSPCGPPGSSSGISVTDQGKFPRSAGILLHPTSLPGPFGIGDLGPSARAFVDFLVAAGQSYWQVLPLTPTGYGDSPYQSLSAFAGNPMLIDPLGLMEAGYLTENDLGSVPDFPDSHVDFGWVIPFKQSLLERASRAFQDHAAVERREQFERFCVEQAHWLDDFALFTALKEVQGLRPWQEWPWELASRQPEALAQARHDLAERIVDHRLQQWLFFQQWQALKAYANDRGIRLIGDIPIFVSMDSADVWANTAMFHFDGELKPTVVSGVPPDYFSETGQLWGHPLYRWDAMANDRYAWWIRRFRWAFTQADVVRIDHFRGFHDYWEIPTGAPTAQQGCWRRGPGSDLFREVRNVLGELALIAEDLGDLNQQARAGVDTLKAEFGWPGMHVLQFAFGAGPDNPFLPHNHDRESVVYTGTHDNDTTTGWYEVTSTEAERHHARQYLATGGSDIAWSIIRLAWGSVAHTALTVAQDLLGLGHWARMNTPGTVGPPNWCWRLLPDALNQDVAARLRDLTHLYGRLR
ncbi:MAG: 4-alpha-glucanotransferase [Anaerolineales bacterium]|nr:4-alpha-glucanotransferase [Anaerolineales bacterium]